jgi:hypothetical protein
MVLDKAVLKSILSISCSILQKHFFYCNDSIARFLEIFTDVVGEELECSDDWMDQRFKNQLKHDILARKDFTCYFVTCMLHEILTEDLFFSPFEMTMFQNFLPRYAGAKGLDIIQKSQRAHY